MGEARGREKYVCHFPPDADQKLEELPEGFSKATRLPLLSTHTCGAQLRHSFGHVYFDSTNVRTCAASSHRPHEPHWPMRSHDLQSAVISRQCTTSHGPSGQSSEVEHWICVMFLTPLQCPACFSQSRCQGILQNGGDSSPVVVERRH